MSEKNIYQIRFERERLARKEAERLLEEKSLELYNSNQALEKLNAKLEDQIAERTEELKEAKDDLEMIAYIASHDLKTPLRSIAHISNWIEEDIESGDYSELFSYTGLLRTRVNRIEGLLNSLIEYTNLTNIQEVNAQVDTKELVHDILQREMQKITFDSNLNGAFPVLNTSQKLLDKVFRNLIKNALKYNDKTNKTITISAKPLGDFTEFSVTDNGNGIEDRFAHKIFELFQTLERKDEMETSGVGLPIVKKIVTSQGGHISFESVLNVGTTFSFTWKNT